jgi:hypothetical protein
MDAHRSPCRSAAAITIANASDVGGKQVEQSTSMLTRWSLSRTALAAPSLMFQAQMSRVASWLMMRLVLYMLP